MAQPQSPTPKKLLKMMMKRQVTYPQEKAKYFTQHKFPRAIYLGKLAQRTARQSRK